MCLQVRLILLKNQSDLLVTGFVRRFLCGIIVYLVN